MDDGEVDSNVIEAVRARARSGVSFDYALCARRTSLLVIVRGSCDDVVFQRSIAGIVCGSPSGEHSVNGFVRAIARLKDRAATSARAQHPPAAAGVPRQGH